jgi:KaiC/GvpD/RAD55 family RecA-like ATPase
MTLKIEQIFINRILNGEILFETILERDFDVRCLQDLREPYEYIYNYWLENKTLPDQDLLLTRYNYLNLELSSDIKTEEILDSLEESNKKERFYKDLQQTVQLFNREDSVEKSIDFLKRQIGKYEKKETDKDVYDLTNPKDLEELNRLQKERQSQFEQNGFVGLSSGFGTELDEYLNGGWQKGNLYGFVAPTGNGKTWCCVRSTMGAFKNNVSTLFISLEGTYEKESYRILSGVTEIENDKLHKGKISKTQVNDIEIDEFTWALSKMAEFGSKYNTHYYLGLRGKNFKYTPDMVYRNIKKYKPGLVVVDYPGLMSLGGDKDTWDDYNEISKMLKSMAVSENVPIIAPVQTSKGSISKDVLSLEDSQWYGIQRDYDFIFGIKKVKGERNKLRMNSVKTRDGKDEFDAVYQTDWNKCLVKFLYHVNEGDF